MGMGLASASSIPTSFYLSSRAGQDWPVMQWQTVPAGEDRFEHKAYTKAVITNSKTTTFRAICPGETTMSKKMLFFALVLTSLLLSACSLAQIGEQIGQTTVTGSGKLASERRVNAFARLQQALHQRQSTTHERL